MWLYRIITAIFGAISLAVPARAAPIPPPAQAIPAGKGDPAAVRIDFQLVSRSSHPYKGRVRIVGVVRNVSNSPFPSVGSALLWEETPGAPKQQVAKKSFGALAPGQEVTVSYERDWFTQVSFKPVYRLIVTVDPDYREENYNNNVLTRSGADIDKLFTAAPSPPTVDRLRLRPEALRLLETERPQPANPNHPRLPDLVVVAASIQVMPKTGPHRPILWVTVRVKNIGTGPSPAKPNVGMVQAVHADGCGWGNGTGLPALAPGASHTVGFPVYYLISNPRHMVGNQRFIVRVNAGKWIVESNYANNSRPVGVYIPPSLVP